MGQSLNARLADPRSPVPRDQDLRYNLAAVFGVGAQLRPSAGNELLVRIAESGRRDDTLRSPTRALLVTGPVDRIEHGFGKPAGFAENGFGHITRVSARPGYCANPCACSSSSSTKRSSRSGARYMVNPLEPVAHQCPAASLPRPDAGQSVILLAGNPQSRDDVRRQKFDKTLYSQVCLERGRIDWRTGRRRRTVHSGNTCFRRPVASPWRQRNSGNRPIPSPAAWPHAERPGHSRRA